MSLRGGSAANDNGKFVADLLRAHQVSQIDERPATPVAERELSGGKFRCISQAWLRSPMGGMSTSPPEWSEGL